MSEIINNPFKEEWENFDKEEFRERLIELVNDIVDCSSFEELYSILDKLDEELGYYMILFRFKNNEKLEVIPISELPEELRQFFRALEAHEEDGVVPAEIVEELKKDINSNVNRKDNKNDWLL